MISHLNVIANVLQLATIENTQRDAEGKPNASNLGLLPFSHIYGLTIICHGGLFRGDEVIVLPKYELDQMLAVVDKFSVNVLYLVGLRPNRSCLLTMLISLTRYRPSLSRYSVTNPFVKSTASKA